MHWHTHSPGDGGCPVPPPPSSQVGTEAHWPVPSCGAGGLTRSSTVAGPRDRSLRVPRPVPNWGPEPGRPPADRWPIMSVGEDTGSWVYAGEPLDGTPPSPASSPFSKLPQASSGWRLDPCPHRRAGTRVGLGVDAGEGVWPGSRCVRPRGAGGRREPGPPLLPPPSGKAPQSPPPASQGPQAHS